jgi:hypothetical protein
MSKLSRVLVAGSMIAIGACASGAQEKNRSAAEEPLAGEEYPSIEECSFEETVMASSGLNCRECPSVDCDVVVAYPDGTNLCGIETASGDCVEGYSGWDLTSDGCWVASAHTDWPTEECWLE